MSTIELHLKRGQAIDLTDEVRVIILTVTHDKCKIGIEAPDHIRILRSELVEKLNGKSDDTLDEKRRDAVQV